MHNISEKSALGKEIAEKKRQLRQLYGGMMSPSDLDRELGFRSKGRSAVWAKLVNLPSVQVSPARRAYETDLVAEAIVKGRCVV